jgi:hypothetical protein
MHGLGIMEACKLVSKKILGILFSQEGNKGLDLGPTCAG